METSSDSTPFDAIVIGTGFAGAVTACRLVEAGFRICVLERGRRYGPDDFPRFPADELFPHDDGHRDNFAPPPDFSRWLWQADHGIYDVQDLGDALAIQAAGYGGGSLIYANVHLRPPLSLFDERWPAEYRGDTLNPYFDLAAWMLRAKPIPTRLAKTLQHKRASNIVSASSDSWFRVPLAINFDGDADAPAENAFGRNQQACDMRGRCFLGCDHQSKNTLDLNYLARAEDAASSGSRQSDIRTLAEVTGIRYESGVYTVTYDDHLVRGDQEKSKTEQARHVFLCAGAVNTTALLSANQELWKSQGAEPPVALGSHYFPNASSVDVVFNCTEPHEADYGPTITSGFLYQHKEEGSFSRSLDFYAGHGDVPPSAGDTVTFNGRVVAELSHDPILDWGSWKERNAAGTLVLPNVGSSETIKAGDTITIGKASATVRFPIKEHEHWLLIEDGGYPSVIEPLVNVFRSPLWIRRNRFLEHDGTPFVPIRTLKVRPRLNAAAEALSGTPRSAVAEQGGLSRTFNFTSSLSGTSGAQAGSSNLLMTGLLGAQIADLLPQQLVDAIRHDRVELFEQASAYALPVLGRLLRNVSRTAAQQVDQDLLAGFAGGRVGGPQLEVLIRGMLRQAIQILVGSEAKIARDAVDVLGGFPSTSGELFDKLAQVVLWALAYNRNDGHTGLLLTIGRDLYRGRLEPVSAESAGPRGPRLKATLPRGVVDTVSVTHERLARAFARDGWQGELRTNPAKQFLDKHVTVHSQGGCPMGEKGLGVTDAFGEVYGCPGLYVMDAAAFPTSVGVNPSATIAAVAEFKVEQFIRHNKKDSPTWEADKTAARDWVEAQPRSAIDPLNSLALPLQTDVPAFENPPKPVPVLGLKFDEVMNGFLTRVPEATNWDDLDRFPDRLEAFRKAEDTGAREDKRIQLALHVTANDLARVITLERSVPRVRIPVAGKVSFTPSDNFDDAFIIGEDVSGYLQILLTSPSNVDTAIRFFRYELEYQSAGSQCRIRGLKVLQDTPGFDVWHDTSTTYFEVFEAGWTPVRRGIMRVPLDTFLTKQLKGMSITGTDDPARQSWALAAFGKYFAGELLKVYSTRAKQTRDAIVRFLTEIHV